MMNKIKYIFSINSGRAGSCYLRELFCHAMNVHATHEPYPSFLGQETFQYNWGKKILMQHHFKTRIKQINEVTKKGVIYCETNNAFIKGFYEFVLENYPHDEIGVVFLKRPIDDIVNSLISLEFIPNSSEWMLWSNFPTNLTKCTGYSEEELCRWYVEEIWARGVKFKKENPQIKIYEVNLYDLNTIDNVKKMFVFFGLQAGPSLTKVVGRPVNTKEERYEKKLSYN